MKEQREGARKLWNRYKYVVFVVLIGAGLLLWPSGTTDTDRFLPEQNMKAEPRDLETEMADILGAMSGVGQVRVMLTVDSDGERQLAQDTELTYSGSGTITITYREAVLE